jgi:hypothetical protein
MGWPMVVYCASCGRPDGEHPIRSNGERGAHDGMTGKGGTRVPCTGWAPGRTDERPPEGELRRRLTAIEVLHKPVYLGNGLATDLCSACWTSDGDIEEWPCPTVRLARGMDPAGEAAGERGR